MLNRDNYHMVQEYLLYMEEHWSPGTVRAARSRLRHLLEWAGETPFCKICTVRAIEGFPSYLRTARNDRRTGQLSAASLRHTCSVARGFFEWLCDEHPRQYRHVTARWLKRIVAPSTPQIEREPNVWLLPDVQRVLAAPARTRVEQRDQATVALGYLSAARASALVTLPIRAIDIENRKIKQFWDWGVRTKGRKSRTTYLLEIPDLLDVVSKWDRLVRSELSGDALWYATFDGEGRFTGKTEVSQWRHMDLRRGLKKLCEYTNTPYHSPHGLRHGHLIWAIEHADNVLKMKAISQNLMHEQVDVTDAIYAKLTDEQVRSVVRGLGVSQGAGSDKKSTHDAQQMVQEMTEQMQVIREMMKQMAKMMLTEEGIEKLADQIGARILGNVR